MSEQDLIEQESDPKLIEAMAEIKAVLNKHDIGGHIALVSPTHAEFMYRIDPSWSSTSWETTPGGQKAVRVCAKSSVPGDREKLENTAHMLCRLRDMSANCFGLVDGLIATIEQEGVDIDHNPTPPTPHEKY